MSFLSSNKWVNDSNEIPYYIGITRIVQFKKTLEIDFYFDYTYR